MDSAASHHVTSDIANLSHHQNYEGPDNIMIGDGSGLSISHTGFTTLPACSNTFSLSNVLCAPSIHKNLISVSKFCKTNQTSVEFFPNSFIVKDLRTGAHLLQGQNKHDVYEWPSTVNSTILSSSSTPLACTGIKASPQVWHNRLGHPSNKITSYLASSNLLSLSSKLSPDFHCVSCHCNKSHRLHSELLRYRVENLLILSTQMFGVLLLSCQLMDLAIM